MNPLPSMPSPEKRARHRTIRPVIQRTELSPHKFEPNQEDPGNVVRIDISMAIITDAKTASRLNINPHMMQELFAHMAHPDQVKCVECTADAMAEQK